MYTHLAACELEEVRSFDAVAEFRVKGALCA